MTPLVEALARESSAVARAQGLDVDADERVTYISNLLAAAGSSKSSMLQDVEAHRKTEIEVINRAVADAGRANGIPTPLNDAMVALVGGLEGSWAR
jgi:2-dehydropantoate 2-reductase